MSSVLNLRFSSVVIVSPKPDAQGRGSLHISARIMTALWYLSFVNYMERVTMGFAAPFIMTSLHMPAAQFGIVLSSFGIGYLLAIIPGGVLSDRWGARNVLIIGPTMWAIFTGATGLVST